MVLINSLDIGRHNQLSIEVNIVHTPTNMFICVKPSFLQVISLLPKIQALIYKLSYRNKANNYKFLVSCSSQRKIPCRRVAIIYYFVKNYCHIKEKCYIYSWAYKCIKHTYVHQCFCWSFYSVHIL